MTQFDPFVANARGERFNRLMTLELTAPKRQILDILKLEGSLAATELAARLELTPTGVRQHLAALAEADLVEFDESRGRVGRPARKWRLARGARIDAHFPDGHADLAKWLLSCLGEASDEAMLDEVLRIRMEHQAVVYRAELDGLPSLRQRIERLAAIRTREGYMAEVASDPGGSLLLIENHCPIASAASLCEQLCVSERNLFEIALGHGVDVERTEYRLAGDRRCVYRITQPATAASQ